MRVVATRTGFDGIAIRNEGDEFNAPKDAEGKPIAKASWYKPVETKPAVQGAKPGGKDGADLA